MSATATPFDLYFDQLNDLFSVEDQLEASLPELASLVMDRLLFSTIKDHARQTREQRSVIAAIFERHGRLPVDDECKAMAGLIEGGTSHLKAVENRATRDLMMIAHCLRVEHYETAAYEITGRLAHRLGFDRDAKELAEIRMEEEATAASLLAMEPRLFHIAQGS